MENEKRTGRRSRHTSRRTFGKKPLSIAISLAAIVALVMMPITKVSAYQVYDPPASTNLPTTLQNPSFEIGTGGNPWTFTGGNYVQPLIGKWYDQIDQSLVPGWSVVADNLIEIWYTGFTPPNPGGVTFNAPDGSYFAELNANSNVDNGLYQDLATDIGSLYGWSVEHRGRMSDATEDVAWLKLGDPVGADSIFSPANLFSDLPGPDALSPHTTRMADVNDPATPDHWSTYTGYYTADSAITRFALLSIDTISDPGAAEGNLVDNTQWYKIADPDQAWIWSGDAAPSADDLINYDVVGGFTDNYETPFTQTAPGDYNVIIEVHDGTTGALIGHVVSTIHVRPLVTVNYVNQNGDPIAPSTTFKVGVGGPVTYDPTTYDSTGLYPYDTTTMYPATIQGSDGTQYVFSQLDPASDPAQGTADKASGQNVNVTYVYTPVPAQTQVLTINYVDDKGNVIQAPTTQSFNQGDPYSQTPPQPGDQLTANGQTYEFVQVTSDSDPLSGTMDTDKAITYQYKLVPVTPAPQITETKTVTINFIDENGNPIQSPTATKYTKGAPYSETPPQPGDTLTIGDKTYKFVQVTADSDALSGTMDTDKTITYQYQLVQPAQPAQPPATTPNTSTTPVLPVTGDPAQTLMPLLAVLLGDGLLLLGCGLVLARKPKPQGE